MGPVSLLMCQKRIQFLPTSRHQVIQLEIVPFLTLPQVKSFNRHWFHDEYFEEVKDLLKPILVLCEKSNIKDKHIKSKDCIVGENVRVGYELRRKTEQQILLTVSATAKGRKGARIQDIKLAVYVCPRSQASSTSVSAAFSQLLKEEGQWGDQVEISSYFLKVPGKPAQPASETAVHTSKTRPTITSASALATASPASTTSLASTSSPTSATGQVPAAEPNSATVSGSAASLSTSTSSAVITESCAAVSEVPTINTDSVHVKAALMHDSLSCLAVTNDKPSTSAQRRLSSGKKTILKNMLRRQKKRLQSLRANGDSQSKLATGVNMIEAATKPSSTSHHCQQQHLSHHQKAVSAGSTKPSCTKTQSKTTEKFLLQKDSTEQKGECVADPRGTNTGPDKTHATGSSVVKRVNIAKVLSSSGQSTDAPFVLGSGDLPEITTDALTNRYKRQTSPGKKTQQKCSLQTPQTSACSEHDMVTSSTVFSQADDFTLPTIAPLGKTRKQQLKAKHQLGKKSPTQSHTSAEDDGMLPVLTAPTHRNSRESSLQRDYCSEQTATAEQKHTGKPKEARRPQLSRPVLSRCGMPKCASSDSRSDASGFPFNYTNMSKAVDSACTLDSAKVHSRSSKSKACDKVGKSSQNFKVHSTSLKSKASDKVHGTGHNSVAFVSVHCGNLLCKASIACTDTCAAKDLTGKQTYSSKHTVVKSSSASSTSPSSVNKNNCSLMSSSPGQSKAKGSSCKLKCEHISSDVPTTFGACIQQEGVESRRDVKISNNLASASAHMSSLPSPSFLNKPNHKKIFKRCSVSLCPINTNTYSPSKVKCHRLSTASQENSLLSWTSWSDSSTLGINDLPDLHAACKCTESQTPADSLLSLSPSSSKSSSSFSHNKSTWLHHSPFTPVTRDKEKKKKPHHVSWSFSSESDNESTQHSRKILEVCNKRGSAVSRTANSDSCRTDSEDSASGQQNSKMTVFTFTKSQNRHKLSKSSLFAGLDSVHENAALVGNCSSAPKDCRDVSKEQDCKLMGAANSRRTHSAFVQQSEGRVTGPLCASNRPADDQKDQCPSTSDNSSSTSATPPRKKKLRKDKRDTTPMMNLTTSSSGLPTSVSETKSVDRPVLSISDMELQKRVCALKEELHAVYHGTVYSERHKRYMNGGSSRRCLDTDAQLHCVEEGQEDVIMDVLLGMFDTSRLTNVDYLLRVILPEAVTRVYNQIHHHG